ncbi:MAG: hypothetical protein IIC60_05260 [Proteobacteria bacterium]|nr:hypothetical protein [Pseudomonadota bacterium]
MNGVGKGISRAAGHYFAFSGACKQLFIDCQCNFTSICLVQWLSAGIVVTRLNPTMVKKMKYCLILILFLMGSQAVNSQNATLLQGDTLSANDVITLHVEAIGGSEAIQSIRNLHFLIEITEPAFKAKGDYRVTRSGFMRIDIFIDDKRVFSEGIDSSGGWQQDGMEAEVTDISNAGLAALERGVDQNILGLYDLSSRGHHAELFGREQLDEVNYYVIKVVTFDGYERHYYINPKSWYIERVRETSALHPDIDSDEKPTETVYDYFIPLCGVIYSRHDIKIEMMSNREIQRTSIIDASCNEDVEFLEIARPQSL